MLNEPFRDPDRELIELRAQLAELREREERRSRPPRTLPLSAPWLVGFGLFVLWVVAVMLHGHH